MSTPQELANLNRHLDNFKGTLSSATFFILMAVAALVLGLATS